MTRRNTNLAANNDLLNQYLTPAQLKRLQKKENRIKNQEQPTYEKTERHHENRVANLKPLVPLTENQALLIDSLKNNVQTIAYGVAGSGKSFITTTYAAQEFLKGNVDQIIITRSTAPIDRTIGFRPGSTLEKLSGFMAESISILKQVLSPAGYEIALKNEDIILIPFEEIRGRSFKRAFVIVTEAQNASLKELQAFVTRNGESCKVVIEGDPAQSDINGMNGLSWVIDMVNKYPALQEYTGIVKFVSDDIVRSGLCKIWVKILEKEYGQ